MFKAIIVDDEVNIRKGLEAAVNWQAHGFTIAGMAADGAEALELYEKEKPVLVVTDIKMPRLDGLELVKNLKKLNPDVNIVLISGYNEFEYAREGIRYGVVDYLLKPVDFDELAAVLDRIEGQVRQGVRVQQVRERDQEAFRSQQKLLEELRKSASGSTENVLDQTVNSISTGENITSDSLFRGTTLDAPFPRKNPEVIFPVLPNADSRLKDVVAYVRSHYQEEINLKKLAELFFFHPVYFGQLFKSGTGRYFHDFVNEVRIENALHFLQEGNLSINEISCQVGYKNHDHFYKCFRKVTGLNPGEYKKKYFSR